MRRVTLCRDARSERPLYHSKMASVVSQQNDSYSNARPERPSPVPQRIQIPMHQHTELARCVLRQKKTRQTFGGLEKL